MSKRLGIGLFPISSIVLSTLLIVIVFVPSVLDPSFRDGATAKVCNRNGCVAFVQIESISYAYAGWGGYYQTDGYYTVEGWFCSCPPNSTSCCVPPYAGIVWALVTLLLGFDILCLFLAVRRLKPAPKA